MAWRHFSDAEVEGLEPKLVEMLDRARGFCHYAFIITSGRRTEDQNSAAGGVSDSSHLRGLAVDLRCTGSQARFEMVSSLLLAGFRRIGIYRRHLHADADDTLPQAVMWMDESD
jgi:uncharacterized protein YcbK (DUF882 family)